jgi:hypothetical protein
MVVHLWAAHPDLERRPVTTTLSTPCGVISEEILRTGAPAIIVLELPDTARQLDLSVNVSRTWRPAAHGATDPRELGVAVAEQFLKSREEASTLGRPIAVPRCVRPES